VSVTEAPPRPAPLDPEALFDAARRHRRTRRLRALLLAVVGLAAAGGLFAALGGGSSSLGLGGGPGRAAAPRYRAVVVVVDVSGSMRATDVKPTRLDATRAALERFVGLLPKRLQIGVVSFSTSAKVVVAPTRDRARVLGGLRSLEPLAGTALGDGLDAAVRITAQLLRQGGVRRLPGHDAPAAIVLESDGAQNRGATTPLAAARHAKADGIRVDGVALGTKNGSVQFGFGLMRNSIPVPPDPATVGQIASVTGGRAYTARDAAGLLAIYQGLAKRLGA